MSKTAEQLIAEIDAKLPKWIAWFPNEESEVEVPRCHLITLIAAARVGVAAAKRFVECNRCGHPTNVSEALLLEVWECGRCSRRQRFLVCPATRSPSSAPAAPTEPGSATPTAS